MPEYDWENSYTCKECGGKFPTASEIQKHIKRTHFSKYERQGKAIWRRRWD